MKKLPPCDHDCCPPTHCELQRLRGENARLAAALQHVAGYWNGIQTEEAMYDACMHIQAFASSASGGKAFLSGLISPTIELLETMLQAMRDYQMDVDELPPYKHRKIVERAIAELARLESITKGTK
jgi:N-acetylglucosamine-6-phosphate deacetylase